MTRTSLAAAALMAATLAVGCAQAPSSTSAPAAPAHDMAMDLHHMHAMMSHGLEMGLEGANLKMLGQMNMAGAVDAAATSHGDTMLSEGRALITSAMSGPAMAAMHASGTTGSPLMTYTHELSKAMTDVLAALETMPAPDPKQPGDMAMHHMHIALAHAALMASQAATLKMNAAMGMSEALDKEAATHAAAMFVHATGLYEQTMNGDGMKATHDAGGSGGSMDATHAMGEKVKILIDSLAKMP